MRLAQVKQKRLTWRESGNLKEYEEKTMYLIELVLLVGVFAVLGAFVTYGFRSEESDRRQAYWARYEDK